jgi:hypothetical protein
MEGVMRTTIAGPMVVLLSAAWAACDDDGSGRGPCDEFNWRAETADQIVCPYTPDCACPSTDVCCVTVVDDEFDSASCSPLTDCAGLAFECDGPEDCGDGDACCADLTTGGGSSCTGSTECIGVDEVVMCREDDDCETGWNCLPAESGSYFDGIAGYCGL